MATSISPTTTAPFAIPVDQAKQFAPIVTFHMFEQFFPCSIDWLLEHSTLMDGNNPAFSKKSPTQSDLADCYQPNYYLDVDSSYYAGQTPQDHDGEVVAPMYVTAQEWDDCIEITYAMLYAFQGGQVCRGLPVGNHFNCIVNDFGKHQGDLEWISVLVTKDLSEILAVGYEAHGDETYYQPGQYLTEGTHPLIRVALNGHPCYNGQGKNDNDWIFTYELQDIVGTIDLITKAGTQWRPFEAPNGLVMIGLDERGDPIGDQRWAKFQGRLGNHLNNELRGATDVDGHTGLSDLQWGWVEGVDWFAKVLDKLPGDAVSGDGPWGPGSRDFVQGQRRRGIRNWFFNNGYTGRNASAPPDIVAFSDLFHAFYRDGSGNGILHITSEDGINWSGHSYIGYNTSAGPCAIVFKDQLHVFFRDGSGNGILHVVSSDGESFAPTPNWYIGLNCDGQPTAAVLNDKLCVLATDHGGKGIMRAVSENGEDFTNGYTGRTASARPDVVAFQDAFHAFYRDGSGNGILHVSSPDGVNWSGDSYIGYNTSAGPRAIALSDELLHVFYRDGSGNGILHDASPDGASFAPWPSPPNCYIGLNCNGEPATAALNKTLCVVAMDAEGNGIMRAVA